MTYPSHIAIIMDGNGRWGLKHYNNRNKGHYYGLSAIEQVIKNSIKLKIKYLTLYTFSTENWKRPKEEIDYLFYLLKIFYLKKLSKLKKNNIKINFLGNISQFPKNIRNIISKVKKQTNKNNQIIVNFAFNYGSKLELIRAFNKIIMNKKIKKVNERLISNNLYTNNIPDPEILIRTGGDQRLSNFLLWQLSYAEIFFLKKNWPDFNFNDLKKIIIKFTKIKRNFGSVNE